MAEVLNLDPQPKKNGTRTRRLILAIIAFLFLVLIAGQVFLHRTSVGSPRFIRMTLLLWVATVVVVLALLILATVLGRNLIKLYFERKSGRVGSRFKTKMVSTFVVLSLIPAVLLFFLAKGLIDFSIEQWFSAPAIQMLENSKAIASQYYGETRQWTQQFVEDIAAQIGSAPKLSPLGGPELERYLQNRLRASHMDGMRIFDTRGVAAVESGKRISLDAHKPTISSLVASALRGQSEFRVARLRPDDALNEVVWASTPIRSENGAILGALLAEKRIPQSIYFKAYSVLEAYNVYAQLEKDKSSLRFNFIVILALSTLLIVFAFSWFAMYLAKRITVPIQALAEGAAAVAAGDLNYRVECEAFDELEGLVVSFNRMTQELLENKIHIEKTQDSLQHTNVELDTRRRYIETILQTIATGVISLDSLDRIRTMNPAAAQMFNVQDPAGDLALDDVIKGEANETLRMLLRKSVVLGPIVRNIELALPGKTLHLAATVTPFVDSSGQRTGWVVVLDDVTELLRIEKMTAWQEVARRLAHEIKNPLTPIQLSAERILRRYRQISERSVQERILTDSRQEEFAGFGTLLDECIRTIIQEAGSLKKLVDEFSRFARMPGVRLEDADLHQVIDNTIGLYNGRTQDLSIVRSYDSALPKIRIDPEQMKRVFINLIDNALEAMAGGDYERKLQIITRLNAAQRSVRIEISDTGRGFPKEYQDSLFLPYFSTRKGGTGLGLAIVRQIVSDHHGYVRAEPTTPRGTKIVIDLPLAQS